MKRPEPWVCPRCGRKLRIANQEHVCGVYDLEPHFERKDPLGRLAFSWINETLGVDRAFEILPMKTFVTFVADGNFAFLTTKRAGATLSLVLVRTPDDPRLTAEVPYSRVKRICRFALTTDDDLDESLASLLIEAYETSVGQ